MRRKFGKNLNIELHFIGKQIVGMSRRLKKADSFNLHV